jgi:dipeptidyl aminopeptidase/acylaminoacyl peptidase
MLNIDGIIRKRETVTPGTQIISTVKQLYSEEVIEKTIVEKISYISGGLNINGYIARPEEKGSFPVLIWNRGGNEEKGALDDLRAYLVLASTAAWGYVVLATQYRGNMGSDGVEDWGGEDLTDALNMIEVAKNLPECDTDRIAVEGASRGGMTTYRALLKYSKFKCALIHAGITDVPALIKARPGFEQFISERYSDLTENEKAMELKDISAVHFADKLPKDVPILIMHGTNDTVVPVEQSKSLAVELEKHGVPHKLVLLDGGSHVALKDGTYREIDRHRREWLETYLI